jgi:hypothetical protein
VQPRVADSMGLRPRDRSDHAGRPMGRNPAPGRRMILGLLLLSLLALTTAACGLRTDTPPPGPGWERGGVPDLRGARVLLLPVQGVSGTGLDVDAELLYALRSAGPSVRWMAGEELQEIAARAGRLGADPQNLPVAVFEAGEVRRVGDPLFGELYRLAAMTDAGYALLPITVQAEGPDADGLVALNLNAALLDPRSGQVLWQGILQGTAGEAGSPGPLASAAEALAQRVLP